MFSRRIGLLTFCIFSWCGLLAAQITGTVTNGTTNKPASGDEVILLSLSGGMEEVARTHTDAQGHFSLPVTDPGVQHLVRVVHDGVNYHKPAPQGTTTADVTVYDAAKTVNNLIGEGRVIRLQTANGQLQVSEMYILRNESSPPRTQMSDRSFEIVIPEGARLNDGMAAGPGGMPVTSSPVPTGKKNHYAFEFPIRPGQTQFQVTYEIPYSGSYDFNISPHMPLAELGVMLPKSMRFTATGDAFARARDEAGLNVYVAKSLSAGQVLKFEVQGEGVAPREAQENAASSGPGAPGGGMGPPNKGANPLSGSNLLIMGGLLVGLCGGAFWFVRRQNAPAAGSPAATDPAHTARPQRVSPSAVTHSSTRANTATPVLDVLKEELFQLESERLQGKISKQEYETAKAGLDALLRRQMKS